MSYICQREEELETRCLEQCEHCKIYYNLDNEI